MPESVTSVLYAAVVLALYPLTQVLYLFSLLSNVYLRLLPRNMVDMTEMDRIPVDEYPYIVLFYPVLRELESTMRTTFLTIADLDYPRDRFRVVAIPNADDTETVGSLRRLAWDFDFLEILEVPSTNHPAWQVVWDSWDGTEKAYWWHRGPRAGVRNLPPKKTRQLIFAFYTIAAERAGRGDFLVNYIDADSCPPKDHFLAAAVGMRHFDVLQSQNIAGNLNASLAASLHAADHMSWDGLTYPHVSANGRQPYWVLGKGLYYRASDLLELGGFHPWITIEDPEVGLRFWKNGKRLGIIENPLIEEVPATFARGVVQRKRWVCGFFQSLSTPLEMLGMTRWEKLQSWMLFMPCLTMSFNVIGLPIGAAALWLWYTGSDLIPLWTRGFAVLNVTLFGLLLATFYRSVWVRSAIVLNTRRERLWYLVRINPLVLMAWWLFWTVPLWIGFRMFLKDEGLVWERTEKVDANRDLIRQQKQVGTEPVAGPKTRQAGRP